MVDTMCAALETWQPLQVSGLCPLQPMGFMTCYKAVQLVSRHTHLVFLGNKVVNDEHLEPQLSAQLADILQQALDLPVMLLLQVCHLTMGTQQPEGINALRSSDPLK